MVNTKEIKKRMIEAEVNTGDLAEAIGKSYSTAHSKLNGNTPMTLDEAEIIQSLLHIEDSDFGICFMCHSRIA